MKATKLTFDEDGTAKETEITEQPAHVEHQDELQTEIETEESLEKLTKNLAKRRKFHHSLAANTEPVAAVGETEETSEPTKCLSKKQEKALEYLTQYSLKDNAQSTGSKKWKFNKLQQTWILRHMYYPAQVPNLYFKIVVEYLVGLSEKGKLETVADAQLVLDGLKEPDMAVLKEQRGEKPEEPKVDENEQKEIDAKQQELKENRERDRGMIEKRAKKLIKKLSQ